MHAAPLDDGGRNAASNTGTAGAPDLLHAERAFFAQRHDGKTRLVGLFDMQAAAMRRTENHVKVLVCGGRDLSDAPFIHAELDRLRARYGFDTVIEGDARGVDRIAGEWARSRGLALQPLRLGATTIVQSSPIIRMHIAPRPPARPRPENSG
jgi:hypothetical protein